MLISHAQLANFEQASWRRFVDRLADYLCNDCATLTHAFDGTAVPRGAPLERTIEDLIAVAKTFGLTTEIGLGQFVMAGIGYSRDFHAIPKVADWLRDPRATPEENMQRVIDAILVAQSRKAR